jgi:hypothetical protein
MGLFEVTVFGERGRVERDRPSSLACNGKDDDDDDDDEEVGGGGGSSVGEA